MHCTCCKRSFVAQGIDAGYGCTHDGETLCYVCCAVYDRERMIETGKSTLYLVRQLVNLVSYYTAQNWPGTLRLNVIAYSTGSHNWAGTRIDVWFRVQDGGKLWHGTRYGSQTELLHCKRTKRYAL